MQNNFTIYFSDAFHSLVFRLLSTLNDCPVYPIKATSNYVSNKAKLIMYYSSCFLPVARCPQALFPSEH